MGFLPWNGGEARILEKNLKAYSDRELWRQISYVPQAKRSAFSYGVLEMVVMGLDKENSFFYTPKKDQFDKANEMLKELGVGKLAGRYCNELSGGEQQRIVIARAVLNSPAIILADEPTGNLDVETGKSIVELLHNICESGSSVVMTTHNLQLLKEYPGSVYRCSEHRITDVTDEYMPRQRTIEIDLNIDN